MRTFPAILILLCLSAPAWSQISNEPLPKASTDISASEVGQADPLNSPVWQYLRARFLGEAAYRFDDRIIVSVPPFAEDPTQVPLMVDVSAVEEPIQRLVVWADLNPIQHIYSLESAGHQLPNIAIRFKVQQATPVRAAVLTESGIWLVGGQYLEAAGGGCTAPSMANASPYWESHLGEIESRSFERALEKGQLSQRYKVKIIHPMDTGLVSGIPEFYIQQLELRREDQAAILSMELSQPVSENPVFTFDINADAKNAQDHYKLWMRDNNGNVFEQAL
ncbi:quinoprotein dehydrogenase-associated SoxYZ-like carrier [Neptunomonas phycophila]|uniref:quinoprotein dehydrogenase-associated SoxYZ-like carrier n=1 Tax=Neptunomonas phycophila TaxID=1572645 RepID=UPI001BEB4FFF|nr:quinoprotein dehydrogenase-associated SoxYZ-like carrier [Neptunomonas phycophila]MBT3145294.1 quinoprotein dehydrogenase-associated SoxYZ-like carrier [Neptunomonas phycophila]MDO6784753.1 quinoprotein dehydrogenase-associated SoxYZ-like carrier [Neptunomonas phycophila]